MKRFEITEDERLSVVNAIHGYIATSIGGGKSIKEIAEALAQPVIMHLTAAYNKGWNDLKGDLLDLLIPDGPEDESEDWHEFKKEDEQHV